MNGEATWPQASTALSIRLPNRITRSTLAMGSLRGSTTGASTGIPACPGLPDAAEQEGVHQGIFALAQLGAVLLLAHQLPGIGCGLLAAATLQQQLDGVHMVGDVVADAAVVLVLIHQGGIVLQLVIQLVIQQAVGGLQLRLPAVCPIRQNSATSDTANSRIRTDILGQLTASGN